MIYIYEVLNSVNIDQYIFYTYGGRTNEEQFGGSQVERDGNFDEGGREGVVQHQESCNIGQKGGESRWSCENFSGLLLKKFKLWCKNECV